MDHHARLAWADRHLDALEKSVRDFSDRKTQRIQYQFDYKTSENRMVLLEIADADPDWSLMLSDIVHNLRSALDNLVYRLAVKHSGEAAADSDTRLQFPIADTLEGWEGTKKKPRCQRERIRLLDPRAQAIIERLQPYNRADKTTIAPLSVLGTLSNLDKHKRLVLTLAIGENISVEAEGGAIPAGSRIASTFRGPLKPNTVLARWYTIPPVDPASMKVHTHFGIDIAVGEGLALGRSVRRDLTFIKNLISDEIFRDLDPLL